MKSTQYLPALKDLRQSLVEKRASPGERVLGSLFPSRGVGWPGGWSANRMEQVAHMRNWTYVAVDLIASKIASISPNIAYVVDNPRRGIAQKASRRDPGLFGQDQFIGEGGHSWLTMGAYRSKALSVVKPHEYLEPLETEHPLRRLLENPNPVDTKYDLLYELQMFEELCGVSYLWLVPNEWGIPCELWCIPSHWVWPKTGGGKYVSPNNPYSDRLIQYYEVRPWGGFGSAGILYFPPDQIVEMKWKSPLNKIAGYAKLEAIAQWIDSEESITKSRWSQFMNVARPEFWVELGEGYADPGDDAITRFESKIMQKIQGEFNYGKPVITPPGVKITPLSFSPEQMAYAGSEEQVRDMILSAFRVPKTAVGITTETTYGSILATLSALCVYCLNPRLEMRGQALTKYLASRWSEPGRRVKVWYDDCVPADPTQVNADLAEDRAHHAISINEIRALRGRRAWGALADKPWADGPGGPMPLPLDEADTISELAELIEPMRGTAEEPPGMGGPMGGQPDQAQLPVPEDSQVLPPDARIEEPNVPPQKGMLTITTKDLNFLARQFLKDRDRHDEEYTVTPANVLLQTHTVEIKAKEVNLSGSLSHAKKVIRIEHPDGTSSTATVEGNGELVHH